MTLEKYLKVEKANPPGLDKRNLNPQTSASSYPNLYESNRKKLSVLPHFFMALFIVSLLGFLVWFWKPLPEAVKVMAVTDLVRQGVERERILEPDLQLINFSSLEEERLNSMVNRKKQEEEIMTLAFDSRRMEKNTYYLSKGCELENKEPCQLWSLDSYTDQLFLRKNDLSQINDNEKLTSGTIKFAAFQEGETVLNFIVGNGKDSQTNLIEYNLQTNQSKMRLLDSKNPEFKKYIR